MKNVTRRTYCPMGVPALLNGDFFENVAHLKDFSWSVIFRNDPAEGNRIGQMFETTEKRKETGELSDLTCFALFILYCVVLFMIANKLIPCIRVTRRFLLFYTLYMFLFNIYYCFSFMFWKYYGNGIWFYVNIQFGIICLIIQFNVCITEKFFCLTPYRTDFQKIRQKKYWILFIISAILIFFFYPAQRIPHICPHIGDRFVTEFLCYFVIFFQAVVYIGFEQMLGHWGAKEFVIRTGKYQTGKLVQKKNGEWVEKKLYANGFFETEKLVSKPPPSA